MPFDIGRDEEDRPSFAPQRFARVDDHYSAAETNQWIVMTEAGKTIVLPDAAAIPENHPGFTVKLLAGSNCTVRPPQLDAPDAPVPTSPHVGGTVDDGVYTVVATYLTPQGETTESDPGTVTAAGTVADQSKLVFPSPSAKASASGWNAYVSLVDGDTPKLQNETPLDIGTALTLSAPPSSNGATPPVANTASVCAIDGEAAYTALTADKSVAMFKSDGTDYLVKG